MLKFVNFLEVRPLDNGKEWLVLKPFIVENDHQEVIYTPSGFITDFASIPKVARHWFQPATGKYRKAAVIHDLLYCTQQVSRDKADFIFYQLMRVSQVPKWKAKIIYWAVRLGGWYGWERNKPELAKWIGRQSEQFAQQTTYRRMFA